MTEAESCDAEGEKAGADFSDRLVPFRMIHNGLPNYNNQV